ncbi:MAG TPA: hypothetical protein VLT85_13400 [Terriglobales bacterium]|nr:hypothetical protein [Terriglobales bacterium]
MAGTDSHRALIDQLRHLFAFVIEKLPPGSATLDERLWSDKWSDHWAISLIPSEPHAASVGVHVDRSELVDFSVGSCTWELPYESRDPKNFDQQALIGQTSVMLDAVVSGRCEEKHSLLGTTVTIYLPDGPTRVTTMFTDVSLFSRVVRYQPYA